jgi:hypothetical protein
MALIDHIDTKRDESRIRYDTPTTGHVRLFGCDYDIRIEKDTLDGRYGVRIAFSNIMHWLDGSYQNTNEAQDATREYFHRLLHSIDELEDGLDRDVLRATANASENGAHVHLELQRTQSHSGTAIIVDFTPEHPALKGNAGRIHIRLSPESFKSRIGWYVREHPHEELGFDETIDVDMDPYRMVDEISTCPVCGRRLTPDKMARYAFANRACPECAARRNAQLPRNFFC